jgi:phosphatidylserine/phosphatidylglycerophosphate/cardiolipin synthase-like enzyme
MLTSFNTSARELLARLVQNPVDPGSPAASALRAALVRHSEESTYVVPGDWPETDQDAWFVKAPANASDVEYLIDGPRTFEAMGEAMETANCADHFIYLLGWSLDPSFAFYKEKSFRKLVTERAALDVAVRVLLFNNTEYPINDTAKAELNALRTEHNFDVTCCLDDRTAALTGLLSAKDMPEPIFDLKKAPDIERYISPDYKRYLVKGNPTAYGAHHHKILLVYGAEGLVGFCGGVDLDQNRLSDLHDVHVRVTGEAAKSLLLIAEQRWQYAQDNGVPLTKLSLPRPDKEGTSRSRRHLAQVLQTVGNPDLKPLVESSLWPAIRHAVQRAQRFIYIEDQYFWSLDLVEELVRASERLRHITILVPGAEVGEHTRLRQQAISKLVKIGGSGIENRIGIYRTNAGDHEWVHSKLFVFDDEYAIVGSANANNRGYFLDSEAAIGFSELLPAGAQGANRRSWQTIEANLARRMRIELWHEHLALEPEEVADGVAACVHWKQPSSVARVSAYRCVNLRLYGQVIRSHRSKADAWKAGKQKAYEEGQPFTEPWPRLDEMLAEHRWRYSMTRPWWQLPDEDWDPAGAMDDDTRRILEEFLVDPKR